MLQILCQVLERVQADEAERWADDNNILIPPPGSRYRTDRFGSCISVLYLTDAE